MAQILSAIYQMWPGKPTFTEDDIADLSDKVYLVTGGNTGIGKETARVLYSKNATVWLTSRSIEKGTAAIASIKEAHPASKGRLELLQLDLSDLTTIKASAEKFLAREDRLDVLFNNAGVMFPDHGSKSAQGYELQIGTNCLGPFLFTQLLTPTLISTAKTAPKGSVRVVWTSSSAAEHLNPPGGIDFDNLDYKREVSYTWRYGISKAGNYYHATEYARRHADDGIISVSLNPGNLKSDLDRNCNSLQMVFRNATTYPTINGAYTTLYAGVSDDVKENSGAWIVPWGRIENIRPDLLAGTKSEGEGGTGHAQRWWAWSEEQTGKYA
ncbi:short-chain dehydrogenase [Astrocystis sublimbata]|nr:short-chain dehydrogenase [Astrocystis sublimbata]